MIEPYNWEEQCRWAREALTWDGRADRWLALVSEAAKRGWPARARVAAAMAGWAVAEAEAAAEIEEEKP